MPNKQNAKKALRQAEKRRIQNDVFRNAYKKAVKTVQKNIQAGNTDLKEGLRIAQKTLGKATKKGVLKKNTAARKISRLMKKANAIIKK